MEKLAPLEVRNTLKDLGKRIQVARVRRRMPQDDLAAATGITRKTLYAIEHGSPGIKLGTVLTVLWKLGLLQDVSAVANPDTDEHGKILEAARLPKRARQADSAETDF